jgi:hypothetical protein
MVQKIGALYSPDFVRKDELFYPLSALPEILNVALLAFPVFMAKAAMCYNWDRHLAAVGKLEGGGGGGGGGAAAAHANGGGSYVNAGGAGGKREELVGF